MIDLSRELGVQSFCFRHFTDNAKVASLVREIGLDAIELCAKHVNFGDESTFDRTIAAYQDAGVRIVSVGVQTFDCVPEKEELFFEFAQRAGASHMSVNFHPHNWREAADTALELAAKYDLQLGIHNHGGHHWLGNSQMLKQVFTQTDGRLGLCLDTAWALDARQDPVQMAETFADRLHGLHFKDFVFDRAGKGEDVVVGTGNLDLPALLDQLRAADFDGMAVLEYEADVENPVPALTNCVQQMRQLIAQ